MRENFPIISPWLYWMSICKEPKAGDAAIRAPVLPAMVCGPALPMPIAIVGLLLYQPLTLLLSG